MSPSKTIEDYLDRVVDPAISLLPLTAEPVVDWSMATDVASFIRAILQPPYENLVPDELERGNLFALREADAFGLAARSLANPPADAVVEPIPDFRIDADFGLFAKHRLAWETFHADMLSESLFLSLTHFLEADFSDLDSAVLLSKNLFYKQSFQVMRGYIEDMVVPLYFAEHAEQFDRWIAGDFRIPDMRRPGDGLLAQLVAKGVVPSSLATRVGDAYGRLNLMVHGAERHLMYAGSHAGKEKGRVYKGEVFRSWCREYAGLVRIGMELHARTLRQLP